MLTTAQVSVLPTGAYGHVLAFGIPGRHEFTSNAALKPEDAWNIDSKMDDGMPATGKVTTSYTADNPNCLSADGLTATYVLTHNGINCGLIFKTGL